MVKFITTQGLNYYLDELLKNANSKIILISPFFKLHRRIKEILKNKKQQGLEIILVCRVNDLQEPLVDYSTQIFDAPTLHAKCYMNENEAILTSLNLYEFSQLNNEEMGIYVTNQHDGVPIYQEMLLEAERLCKNTITSPKNTNIKEGGKYMESHQIISVEIVKGSTLKANWKSPMQVIVTDKDEFIDNMPGKDFRFNPDASCGYDWSSEVGQTVHRIRTISNSGYKWLNKRKE